MPVTDIRELEERRRALATEVENMRRERENRSGQLSVNAISAGFGGVGDADGGHLKAVNPSTAEGSLLDGSTFLRSKLDWSLPERGMSTVSFASAGEVAAGKSPDRPVVERPRLERPTQEFGSMDRSGMLAVSSTKVPDAELSTMSLPASTTGLLAQTGSSLQASSLGATFGSNYGNSFADTGVSRMNGITGSDSVSEMLAAARDVDRSCSMSSVTDLRPQVGRLGHADLIARARAVGRETADAIQRAKAPLERLNSVQWPPSFAPTAPGPNDGNASGSKQATSANAHSSASTPGKLLAAHRSEVKTLPRSLSRPALSTQRSRSLQPPLSPRPTSLSQRGVRLWEPPSSPGRAAQRALSPQRPLSPRAQSPRPDLLWGVTSLHQPSRPREVALSPRSSITAYPPSPEDSEISQRADHALSLAAGGKTRTELLRDLSRESSPLSRRRFADRLAGTDLGVMGRQSDVSSRGPPSPTSSIRSVRLALPASSLSEHYYRVAEDACSTKIGVDPSPRRSLMDNLLTGVEGLPSRAQEGTPGRLGARSGLLPSSDRCGTASAAAPPPLPQLLSASSFSTSSLWGPRESPWSKASSSY